MNFEEYHQRALKDLRTMKKQKRKISKRKLKGVQDLSLVAGKRYIITDTNADTNESGSIILEGGSSCSPPISSSNG